MQSLSPSVPSSVFPGARAGCIRTAFVPSLGPSVLSPLCGLSTAAARLGSGTLLAFTRRQKGERLVLGAHRQWELAGVRDVEHRAATPQQLGTGPQVCLRFSREGHLQISAT